MTEQMTSDECYSLVKREEIYLYRPKIVGPPLGRSFIIRPYFVHLPTGESFYVDIGGSKEQWIGYFFALEGEVERIIVLNPPGARGKPGSVSPVYTVFANSGNKIGTYDNSKRLNLFDALGNLSRSFLMPLTVDSAVVMSAVFDQNIIAVASKDVMNRFPVVTIFDYQEYPTKRISFTPNKKEYLLLKTTDAEPGRFIEAHTSILSTGEVVCNVNSQPEIFIITKEGTISEEKTVPPHFKSLSHAENPDPTWFVHDENGCRRPKAEQWFTTWTHSYPAYEYAPSTLIVPRVLYPTFFIDVYSYTDGNIEYLGFARSNKPFLFADSTGIFLLEEDNDTLIVVGRYEIVTPDYREERESGWTTKRLSAEELAGIQKVPPDTSEPCPDCPREKHRPRGYCSKIDTIKLVSADSVEYLLVDSLAPDNDHVILFGVPQECAMFYALQAAQNYIEENPGFDLTIVYTHPYPEELKEFLRLVRTQYECLILNNIDGKRLRPILKTSVCFLVVSKDGKITASADYPRFEVKPK